MYQDTYEYVKTCVSCQTNKNNRRQPHIPLTPLPIVERFERIHIDILGPLPKSNEGYQYVLLIVHSFSKWVEGFPLRIQEAKEIASILFREIICRYGAPRIIVSDRGRNFMSKLVTALCEMFSITRHHTSSYHPQTNSTVERTNGSLTQILRSYIDEDQKNWVELLPCVLMSLRSKPCTEFSPYQLMFGKEMELPIDTSLIPKSTLPSSTQEHLTQVIDRLKVVTKVAKSNQEKQQAKSKARHDLKATAPNFVVGDTVYICQEKIETGKSKKFTPKWVGPYEIVEIGPSFTYKVKNLKKDKIQKLLINASRI